MILIFRRTLLIYICLLFIGNSYATFPHVQNKRDSLLNLVDKEIHDTSKVLLYGKLAQYYLKNNIDSSLYFSNTALYLAEKIDFDYGVGKMYHYLGHAMVVKDNLEKAKEYYLGALIQYKDANKLISQSSVYLALGNVYYVQNNFPDALNSYIAGEKIADSLNLIDLLPHFYNNLAGIYLYLEDFKRSLEYFENALKISELNEDTETSISVLNNMARAYIKLNEINQANEHIEHSVKLIKKISANDAYLVDSYLVKGEIALKSENYKLALQTYKNALEIINQLGPGYLGPIAVQKGNCLTNIGICYFELGDFIMAHDRLIQGYNLAKETGLIGLQRDATLYLSEIYVSLGNVNEAFSYFKLYKILSDSVSNEHTTKEITRLKLQFEFDKKTKEQELEQARKESIQKRKEFLLYLIIAGVLSGLIIFLLLYFLQKSKTQRIHLERKNLELDLESRNKELTTNVMYLLKKNEFIESISDKLKKTKLYFKPENRSFVDNIIKELEDSLSKDSWEEFEVRFQQVHKDFYRKLNDRFPDLSPNEQKLSAFLRLNMSTKEISAITYQSEKSIFTARYRLRKKLGLDEHANLITFLSQL